MLRRFASFSSPTLLHKIRSRMFLPAVKSLFIFPAVSKASSMSLRCISAGSESFDEKRNFDVLEMFRVAIPELSYSSRKGDSGRIGVIGGSPVYTGAPYYAAVSALKMGCDLCTVFCAEEASIPIKIFSPELMVSSFYSKSETKNEEEYGAENCDENIRKTAKLLASRVTSSFSRLDSIVIGPGLGRNIVVLSAVAEIIKEARLAEKSIVLDADALYLVSKNIELVYGYERCILSPNAPEFDRLVNAAKLYYSKLLVLRKEETRTTPEREGKGEKENEFSLKSIENNVAEECSEYRKVPKELEECSLEQVRNILNGLASLEKEEQVKFLSIALGNVVIIKKGQKDLVSAGRKVYSTDAIGSPKRSGGQGDILAGCLGVTACWTGKYVKLNPTNPFNIENEENGILCVGDNAENPFIWGALWASALTKRSSEKAFSVHDRSMSSVDVINCLGKEMKLMEGSKE